MTFSTSFQPSPVLSNAHLQTIWSPLFRTQATPERYRERITLPDGDFLDLDWCGEKTESPLVVLFHGLTGSSNSSYILGLQKVFQEMGWQSVAVNFRSCSGEPNHLPRSYHSGDSAELDFILTQLRLRFPERQLAAVGFSLGGNVLLKYQGEQGQRSPLSCAVAVSVPFRLDICARAMNSGFSRLYRNRFMTDLHQQLLAKTEFFKNQGWHEKASILQAVIGDTPARTFEEFDHKITAPLHGFKSGADYYKHSSCRSYLQNIQKPTLIVHSSDDPFMTPEAIPKHHELSPDVTLELTDRGGHVGFISGSPGKLEYWLERRIPAFLNRHFKV